ncbi:hypothetical protein KHB02_020845 [Bacillus sp. FJAT-50051]|nr:hypothetical protein [Neobacillus citreus]
MLFAMLASTLLIGIAQFLS